MPVPKKRTSRARRDMRRAHDWLAPTFSIACPSCGEPTLRHHACSSCGSYRGKAVLKIKNTEQESAQSTTGAAAE